MLNRRDIVELTRERAGPCVSLYMPTHAPFTHAEQEPVRLNNLVRAVKNDLVSGGLSAPSAECLLQRAEQLPSDSSFWQQQSDGLACFAAPGFFLAKRLPIAVTPQYRLGKRFLIMPLLPLLNVNQRFFVLTLEEDFARLLEATPFAIQEVFSLHAQHCHMAEVPQATAASSRHESAKRDLPRVGGPVLVRRPSDEPLQQPSDMADFLRAVDRRLRVTLSGEKAPLLLACVGFVASMFEAVNSYSNLLPVKIPGSPSHWTTEELHDRALQFAERFLDREQLKARRRFDSAHSNGQASVEVATIVLAAHERLVDTLLVAEGARCNGHFDPGQRTVSLDSSGEDLLERTVGHTLLHNGEIAVLQRDRMPGQQAMAAMFRAGRAEKDGDVP